MSWSPDTGDHDIHTDIRMEGMGGIIPRATMATVAIPILTAITAAGAGATATRTAKGLMAIIIEPAPVAPRFLAGLFIFIFLCYQ